MNKRIKKPNELKESSNFSLLAYHHLKNKEFTLAIEAAGKALVIDPSLVDTWMNLASAQFNLSRFEEAWSSLKKGLELDPNQINMLVLASGTVAKLGDYLKGIELCQKILDLNPRHALALSHLAHCYNNSRQYEKAIGPALKALEIEPTSSYTWLELGFAKLYLDQFEQALDFFQQGLRLNPNHIDLLSNSAMALACLGRIQEAMEMNQKTLGLDPQHESALNNQAKLLCDLGRYKEGIDFFQKILQQHPDHWEVVWNLSLVYLVLGDFKTGLDLYQHRLKVLSFHQHHHPLSSPQWQGEELEGKTLLVRCEQGYGDSIQFLRYIPYLTSYGGRIIIEMPSELHDLFRHLKVPLIGDVTLLPQHDVQVRLMSLMHLLPIDLSKPPAPVSIAATSLRPVQNRIGLVWRGNPKHRKDNQRSLRIEQLAPLLQIEGVQYVCLQQKITSEEKKYLDAHRVETPSLTSWRDTASILETCERVICVDTSVAHLAGSMGISTCILLPYVPDWRWLLERTDTPWYPSVRLFRQTRLDSWDEPIQHLKNTLLTKETIC